MNVLYAVVEGQSVGALVVGTLLVLFGAYTLKYRDKAASTTRKNFGPGVPGPTSFRWILGPAVLIAMGGYAIIVGLTRLL